MIIGSHVCRPEPKTGQTSAREEYGKFFILRTQVVGEYGKCAQHPPFVFLAGFDSRTSSTDLPLSAILRISSPYPPRDPQRPVNVLAPGPAGCGGTMGDGTTAARRPSSVAAVGSAMRKNPGSRPRTCDCDCFAAEAPAARRVASARARRKSIRSMDIASTGFAGGAQGADGSAVCGEGIVRGWLVGRRLD